MKIGDIEYNSECIKCPYDCKQSFRSTIMVCKRTKELKKKGNEERKDPRKFLFSKITNGC